MEFEISLNNLLFHGYHGVLPEEKRMGNQFQVDLSVFIPYNSAINEDSIEGTVSYAELYEIIESEMRIPRHLLEKIACDIAFRVKKNYPIVNRGHIRIQKITPPVPGMIGSASIILNF